METGPDAITSPAGRGVPSPVGGTWGPLEIVELLGSGGYGSVYRARDPDLARDVALKLIEVPSAGPAAIAGVQREGQLLARIRHPNVVTVHGARQIGSTIGIWMDLVRGRTLEEVVQRDGPFGPDEACVVGASLCRALAAVHAAGLVHRDVKANNVMREAGGRILLMDFGAGWDIATRASRHAPGTVGTPLYMAPEVLAGQPPTTVADLYSAGVLLFYLVTGEYPVSGRTITEIVIAHQRGQRRLLADCRPDLPEGFVRIVERALDAQPERRYQTAGAMLHDLVELTPGSAAPGEFGFVPALATPATPASTTPPYGGRMAAEREGAGGAALAGRVSAVATGVVIGLAAVWVLGLVMSLALDTFLGRPPEFSNDSLFTWWIWGLRSLVAPTFYAGAALLLWRFSGIAVSLLDHVPLVRRALAGVRSAARRAILRLRLNDPVTAGQVLLAVQAAGIALVCYLYRDLLTAIASFIDTADAARLAPLAPENAETVLNYRTVMPLLTVASAIAWWMIWRGRRRQGIARDYATLLAGVALTIVSLFLSQVPYRILLHNEFLRVEHDDLRCYVIGDDGRRLLLHCPDLPAPRNRIVDAQDPALRRTTRTESLFARQGAGVVDE